MTGRNLKVAKRNYNTGPANKVRRRDPYKRIQVNLNVDVVAALDEAAAKREVSRSQLLEYAATKMLMDEEGFSLFL